MFGGRSRKALLIAAAAAIFANSILGQAKAAEQPQFTNEEQELIQTLEPLKVGYVTDRIPVSFQNEETGELDGISRDIFDRICELSGLSFEYVPLPGGPVTYDYLREEGFDLVTSVEYNEANKHSRGIVMSLPYLSTKKVIVGKEDFIFDRDQKLRIAVSTGSQTLKKVLGAQYPNFEIVDYDSIEQCFDAVGSGAVDLLIQNQYVAEYWLSHARYDSLKVIPLPGLDDQLCFSAVTPFENTDPEWQKKEKIIEIIDKTVAMISEDEITACVIRETMEHQYSYTLEDMLYHYRYSIAALAAGLLLVFILTVLIMVLRMKTVKARAEAQVKDHFLSTMSHEMRTPLNGIIGLNQLMKRNLDDTPRMENYLQQSSMTARYLLSLVNDLLDMASIQKNEVAIAEKSFSFPLMLETIASIEKNRMAKKGLDFRIDSDIRYPWLMGDVVHVQQVLLSLTDNAYKFTQEGSVNVAVTQEETGAGAVVNRIVVTDTGCGISEEFQKQIFESFTQDLGTVSSGTQGAGLGMAISYRLAKMMGGDLKVQSSSEQGSTFVFSFPAKICAEETEKNAQERGQLRVLVVEDNELNAEIAIELLRTSGYQVEHAPDGLKAVEIFSASEPGYFRFILMDLLMPVKDGFQTAREIRGLNRADAGKVKIIACTANASPGDRQKAKQSGMDGFITKPIDLNELLAILK